MKVKQLLEQLNQLAKERPDALEMEVYHSVDRIITTYEKLECLPELGRYVDSETFETLGGGCEPENFDSILIS